jgi:hypothetical protein
MAVRTHEKMPVEFANFRTTRLWELRHQQGHHFDKEIEICHLSPEHMMTRVRFCVNEIDNPIKIPIVFTDESMVQVNMHKGGVWRKSGVHIPEAFAVRDLHPG